MSDARQPTDWEYDERTDEFIVDGRRYPAKLLLGLIQRLDSRSDAEQPLSFEPVNLVEWSFQDTHA